MIGCSQVTQDNLYKNFKSVINKRIINLTQNYMELLQTPQYLLDHCFCFSLKELLLLFFVFYEIGYYFGRKNKKRKTSFQNQSNNLLLMSSQLQIRSEQPAEAQKTQKQVHQQSMKLVRQSDEIPFQVLEQSIKGQSKSSQKQNSYVHKSDDQLSRDFLCEKINVQGKKIQSRGIFHMTVQKAENPKFMRKIEKHQIITDYEIQQTNKQNGQLIPFGSKQFFQFSDDNAILQISTYQNFKVQKYPVIQKRLIKTHQFTQYDQNNKANIPMSPSLCENGKFTKFFKNPKKIGQGAFGIVYSVKNIFEGKEYAIKKLFIRSGLGKITMETILNESIKEVNIISQYSHPNIIRFHTCWLQIANLNEAITFNKTHFKQRLEEDISIFQAGSQPNFKKKNSGQECLQISYISSQANSGFSFENQSRNTILSSSRKKNNKGQPISQLAPMIEQQNKLEEDQKQKGYSDMVPVFALYIQMQICPQGSLDKYLQRRKSLNRNFAFLVINQLLRGVGHLHSNGLVHRDLKPGNILIHKKQRLIKIGDFGLSAKINQQIQYGKIGTPSYIAPEIIQKRPIKKQDLHLIDVYSIGVIYFELLNLFNRATKHEKMQKITKLKQSKIQLPGQFKLQKKVIKMMTKSWSRLAVTQIFQLEQYKELSRIVQKDGQILRSWQNISGLDAQHQQN